MKRAISLLLVLFLLVACGAADGGQRSSSEEGATGGASPPSSVAPLEPDDAAGGEAEGFAGDQGSTGNDSQPQAQGRLDRQIIYTASVQLRVDDPRVTAQSLQGLAARFGGYVSAANVYEYTEDQYYASVQLRVSAEEFDAAIEALRGIATEVLQEQLDTQDVTDQYVDLTARIENLERTESERAPDFAD